MRFLLALLRLLLLLIVLFYVQPDHWAFTEGEGSNGLRSERRSFSEGAHRPRSACPTVVRYSIRNRNVMVPVCFSEPFAASLNRVASAALRAISISSAEVVVLRLRS